MSEYQSAEIDRHEARLQNTMDITNPKLLYIKGLLFVLLAGLACALILLEQWSLRTAALLAIVVWASARAYYFAFYVVEHYADPGYRFAGLGSFVRYLLRRRRMKE
jgi:hypothetical protein